MSVKRESGRSSAGLARVIGSVLAVLLVVVLTPGTAAGACARGGAPCVSDALEGATSTRQMAVSSVTTLTFMPTDDATIRSNRPTRNSGAADDIEVDGSPVEDGLIRFEITGVGSGAVTAATLRLFVTNGSSFGGQFDQITNPDWSEDTVTWETAPPGDGGTIAVHGDTGRAGSFIEVDVTAGVTGDGAVSWRISSGVNNGVDYASKEHASGNGPQLIVVVEPATGPSPPEVTVTTPAECATYELESTVLADYVCTDADLATCAGDVANGAAIDTGVPGGRSFSVTATDVAGNSTTVTHSYAVVDTTPPVVTLTTPGDGATYLLGATVSASYGCSDAGLASCVGDVADGAAIDTSAPGARSFAVTGTDDSGNVATVTHSYTVVDATDTSPPVVTVTTPADSATYELGSTVLASYSCTDADLATCVGDVAHGTAIDTSSVGTHSFAVTGTDVTGNTMTVTRSYAVAAAPVGDSYVYELQPDQNFGSNTALRTDNAPLLFSYLRLDAGGVAGAEAVSFTGVRGDGQRAGRRIAHGVGRRVDRVGRHV